MSLPLAVSASPVGIQQRMSAGSKFGGVTPAGTPTVQNGLNKYEPGTAGGLFYFYNPRPIALLHYNVDFGASVAYELAIVSLSGGEKLPGERVLLAAGTARVLEGPERFGLVLGPHQALELTVSGSASAAMIASMWAVDATAYFVG